MFRLKYIIPLIVLFGLYLIGSSNYPKLYIATGYGAKTMATAVFKLNRDPQLAQSIDLRYSIMKYTSSKIDYISKSVTTSFFGLAKQTAVYREGYGACLIGEHSLQELQHLSFTPSIVKKQNVWRTPWPVGDLRKDTAYAEVDTLKLKNAINAAFGSPDNDPRLTAAVVVLYKGELIGEKYSSEMGITADSKLWGWSMTKSITNAMAGILTKQHRLNVNATAPIKEWLNDRRRDITISDLMHMSSGLKWDENYEDVSSVTTMLYRSDDCYQKAISEPYEKAPDTEWKYSSGTTNILSGILRTSIGNDQEYHDFPYKELFNKIGMSSAFIETDAAGTFVGSSYGYATARDWARFGLLYYNDGVWRGDTILPAGWVNYTRTPAKASEGKYGAQFYLNASKRYGDAPEDMYFCSGHRGQKIFIIPSRNIVLVRLGFMDDGFDFNGFLRDVLGAIKQN
jgi:CubicO group peptidase (beta-lactamase class C family)